MYSKLQEENSRLVSYLVLHVSGTEEREEAG